LVSSTSVKLDHRRFHRQEAEALVVAADRVEHALERDLVARQQFQHARHGAGGVRAMEVLGKTASAARLCAPERAA
jgi:predicted RNA-binding protein associated with RNAse of E/G family